MQTTLTRPQPVANKAPLLPTAKPATGVSMDTEAPSCVYGEGRLVGEYNSEVAFNRGRDLAIAMIDAGDDIAFRDPASACPYRAYRSGKAQDRFTGPFILQLLADPSMLEGFNAVLSARLADEAIVDADFYRFSMAEYSSGEVGADGTMRDPATEHVATSEGSR